MVPILQKCHIYFCMETIHYLRRDPFEWHHFFQLGTDQTYRFEWQRIFLYLAQISEKDIQ